MKRPLAGILIIACLVAYGIHYYLDSRIPRATATVQTHPHPSFKDAPVEVRTGPSTRLQFFSAEILIELPHIENILTEAAQRTGFDSKHTDSLKSLKNITSIEFLRGTDFIEITVKHKSHTKAVELTNTIAAVACEYSQQVYQTQSKRAPDLGEKEFSKQKKTADLINEKTYQPITIYKFAK